MDPCVPFQWVSTFIFNGFNALTASNSYSAKDLTIDFLSSVLKMSVFLDIPDSEEFATERLPKNPDFTPVLQLHLAHLHRIDKWVQPAFRQLLVTPTVELKLVDAELIGLLFYHILMKTKAKINHHRLSLAFFAPDAVIDPFCGKSVTCSDSWTAEWWRGLAKQLLHPDAALTESEIVAGFDTVMIPGMCDSCQARSIEWVKAKKVFEKEQTFIQAAVAEVMDLQTDEPIRASMRDNIIH